MTPRPAATSADGAFRLARRPPQSRSDRFGRRPWLVRRLVIYCVFVGVAGAAVLVSPPARAGDNFCGHTVDVTSALHFPLNCDSASFVAPAIHPSELLRANNQRQDRPVFILVAAALTQLLEFPIAHLGLASPSLYAKIQGGGLQDKRERSSAVLAAYLAYLVINVAVLILALALFGWLVSDGFRRAPTAVELVLASLLVFNDITKLGFWSPHTTLLNVLLPLTGMVVAVKILAQPNRSVRWYAGFGLVTGLVALAYGSFVLWLAIAAIVLVCTGARHRVRGWGQLGRRLAAAAASSVTPTLVWIGICRLIAGSYYNSEVSDYRQFVWLWDDLSGRPAPLGGELVKNLALYGHEVWLVGWPALIAVGAVLVVALAAKAPLTAIWAGHHQLIIAALATLAACAVFSGLQGFYRERLAFAVVPPVLVLLAIWGEANVARLRSVQQRLLSCTFMIGGLANFVYLVAKRGPWS